MRRRKKSCLDTEILFEYRIFEASWLEILLLSFSYSFFLKHFLGNFFNRTNCYANYTFNDRLTPLMYGGGGGKSVVFSLYSKNLQAIHIWKLMTFPNFIMRIHMKKKISKNIFLPPLRGKRIKLHQKRWEAPLFATTRPQRGKDRNLKGGKGEMIEMLKICPCHTLIRIQGTGHQSTSYRRSSLDDRTHPLLSDPASATYQYYRLS